MRQDRQKHRFTREFELLLACANQTTNPAQRQAVRWLILRGVNWKEFLALVKRHRVTPHVRQTIRNACADLTPQDFQDRLETIYQAKAFESLRLTGELAAICRRLNEAEIPVMALKGPALALEYYGGVACREFKDIDILTPPEHVMDAARILNSLGYQDESTPLASLGARRLKRLTRHYKHAAFFKNRGKQDSVMVELHWRLCSKRYVFSIRPERLWSENSCRRYGGACFHVLPPLVQLAFLAWHGAEHRFKRLSWLFDFHQALQVTANRDIKELAETAKELSVARHLILSLRLISDLLATEFGGHKRALLLDDERFQLDRAVATCLHAMQTDAMHYEKQPLSELWWTWRMSRGVRPKLAALYELTAPQSEDIYSPAPIAYARRVRHMFTRAVETVSPHRSRRAA